MKNRCYTKEEKEFENKLVECRITLGQFKTLTKMWNELLPGGQAECCDLLKDDAYKNESNEKERVVELINQIGNSLGSPAYAEKILTECGKEILQIVEGLEGQAKAPAIWTRLYNVTGTDDLEGTTFARCTTFEKAQKAKEILEAEGLEDMLDIIQDELPVDVIDIDSQLLEL